ncbi:MAG: prepilin peptidase [Acidaminococcaceae bacterium]|nr:prepilin peptidase [Acidaminococcaceae bacterium]
MKIQLLSDFLVLLFVFGLLIESYIDFRHKIILDEVLLFLVIAGLAYAGVCGGIWKKLFLGIFAGSGMLGLIFFFSKGGMGFGDVKFAGVLGIWTGFPGIFVTLYLAFLIGGAAALFLCLTHKATMKSRIPFGPCLSAGAFLSFFYSSRILDWYWSLF